MDGNLEFEKFVSGKGAPSRDPVVSIHSKGGVGFNNSFVSKYMGDKPAYVGLTYAQDVNNVYIGFFFSKERSHGMLKIQYPRPSYGLFQCKAFFKRYGIDYEKYCDRYEAIEYDDRKLGRLLVIKLRK